MGLGEAFVLQYLSLAEEKGFALVSGQCYIEMHSGGSVGQKH